MSYFNRKVAMITGGASGIGFAVAQRFLQEGASVVITDYNTELGIEAAEKLLELGEVTFIPSDVSKNEDMQNCVQNILDKYQRLDFCCNNAGIMYGNKKLETYLDHEWDHVISTNLKGVWLSMKHQIPALVKQGGAIVNIASTYGLRGGAVDPAYIASKHAIVGLTKALAIEYAAKNIRINSVCPGAIDTPMFNLPAWDAESLDKKLQPVPMKRLGKPEEIAAAVLWLCSAESSFITGTELVADGGLLAG